jgi:integrase
VNRKMQVKGPKTEAGYRTLVLGSTTITALKQLRTAQEEQRRLLGAAYYEDEDLVVCKPDGSPYRPDSVSSMFRQFIDRIGLPKEVHTHTPRDSAASFLAAAGVPASDIAAQLGHKDDGALALKVCVHPMAEGLRRAGAHLDQVLGEAGSDTADGIEVD